MFEYIAAGEGRRRIFLRHHWAHTICVASIGINLFFFWHATKMTQERAFGTSWNTRPSSCLVIPTKNVFAHKQVRAQKTIFAYSASNVPPAVCTFRNVLGYCASNLILSMVFACFVVLFVVVRDRFCLCRCYSCMFVRASSSVLFFLFSYFSCARRSPYLFLYFVFFVRVAVPNFVFL